MFCLWGRLWGAFVGGAFVGGGVCGGGVCGGGVCGGRLQNAPTQHTTKMIDYQSIQLCQSLKLWQSVVMQKRF